MSTYQSSQPLPSASEVSKPDVTSRATPASIPSEGTTLPAALETAEPPHDSIKFNASQEASNTADARRSSATVRPSAGAQLGQYEFIRSLGIGGSGEVFLARDLRLGRLVAIKHLRATSRELDHRFLEEARTTARCSHENIVVIHEVGEHEGHPYMVLEHLDGQTLRQWLRERATSPGQHTPVRLARAIELIMPVVRALAYAHARGVVHRDLKPENVMLTRAGVVKVLDFGIAKILTAPHRDTEVGDGGADNPDHNNSQPPSKPIAALSSSLVGTPRYMSPEQLNTTAIDYRTDLWAVGIMLFELVAGYHPVSGTPKLVRVGDVHEPMPSLRDLAPALAAELGGLVDIVDHCLRKRPEERPPSAQALLAALEGLDPRRRTAHVGADGSPFPGLAAFQEADADRFFGRDRDITRVIDALRSRPLVTVVGPSGAGKSSLIRAGVLPSLKRSGEGWDAYIVRPGRAPLSALASLLEDAAHESAASHTSLPRDHSRPPDEPPDHGMDGRAIAPMRTQPGHLGAQLRARATRERRRTLIFVDQLEELYTLGASAEDRTAFLASLFAAADDASAPLRVVLTIRADFIDRLTETPHLSDALNRGLLLLRPMTPAELRQALRQPLAAVDYRFQPPALADRMVDALAQTRGALPLLQFTAAQLWELRDRDHRLLTESSYAQLGGVAGALAAHADAVLAGMSSARQAVTRTLFERLVTPERTRALVGVTELRTLHADPDLVDDLVQHLATMRLIAVDRDADASNFTVELVHESLIDRWPTLTRWLDENQHHAAMLARLRGAARDWEHSGRAAGLLWTGAAASDAHAWQRRYQGRLARAERDYLSAVHAQRERARRRRRRTLAGLFAMVTTIAVAMSWLAWQQAAARREAIASAAQTEQEALRARDATRMAALRSMPHDPTTQLALLRELEDIESPPLGALDEAKRLLNANISTVVFSGHDDAVHSVQFSPDSAYVVSASEDQTVQVWRADGAGEPVVLRGHEAWVGSAQFSPNGTRVVSGSVDDTVRVWNADGSGEALVLRGHERAVTNVGFNPDGTQVLSAAQDRTVRLWRTDGAGEPTVLRGHSGLDDEVHFSPDGSRVLARSDDNTVRIWSVDGSRPHLVIRGQHDGEQLMSVSRDGAHIASTIEKRSLRIWRTDGEGKPVILRGHEGDISRVGFSLNSVYVFSTARDRTLRVWRTDGRGEPVVIPIDNTFLTLANFSPDSSRVVAFAWDKTVRVGHVDGLGAPSIFRGHNDVVFSANISPNGTLLVSGSRDNTARVWQLDDVEEPLRLQGHRDAVMSADFSPDGALVVSAASDNTVRVWRVDGSEAPVVLSGHEHAVVSAHFSPDGARVVSASYDGTVRVWRADGSGSPVVLLGHKGEMSMASFSPDSARVLSAAGDHTVRIWNADGSGEPVVLRGHEDTIAHTSFSPDGTRVLSASLDGTLRVWSVDGSSDPIVLRNTSPFFTACFSPDGHRVVASAFDRAVSIWSADGRGAPVVLHGHDDLIPSVAFSPDGTRVVSTSRDKTVRIWNADGSGEPIVLRGHEDWGTTAAFSPDGQRVVSASKDANVRIWRADGSGHPVTLQGHDAAVNSAYFSPDGQRVVSASDDQSVRVWSDLSPVGLDDPRLWTKTNYCLPVARRVALLGVSEASARRNYTRCLARVAQARRQAARAPR